MMWQLNIALLTYILFWIWLFYTKQRPKAGTAFATFCDCIYTFYFWAAIPAAILVSIIIKFN